VGGIFRRAQRLRVIFVFVDPPILALFSFFFFSLFFRDKIVLFCLSSGLKVVSYCCYINIAGRKSVLCVLLRKTYMSEPTEIFVPTEAPTLLFVPGFIGPLRPIPDEQAGLWGEFIKFID
jgi:hypothetical protein